MSEQKPPLVIDFHVHMLDQYVFDASAGKTVTSGFGKTDQSMQRSRGTSMVGKMFSPEDQIADMDARGIDKSVITASTVIQGTSWADPKLDLVLCRKSNDRAAEWVAKFPNRFIGSFVLPLQDVPASMQEFERCTRDLKFKVANISSNYQGHYLGAPVYQPFWETVVATDTVVWIHPEGIKDPWFQEYALWNSAGQSIEEAKVMCSLIYDGVMHNYPSAKIIMAHGGGYFPHYMGRLDRNTGNRPATVKNTGGKKPSEFLRSFYYDTCVYDPLVLKTLVERVGVDRLILGSDYPVGEADPVGFARNCGIEGDALAAVAGGNAARLLGITLPH
ncbi:MAG: amidohydrolase family protein [Burkholderiales bacterium]